MAKAIFYCQYKLIIGLFLNSVTDFIQERQTQKGSIGTNPSHSQLAKDHVEHHFNDLAGNMAKIVVENIGKKMIKCWEEKKSVEPLIDLIEKRYFVHPCDVDWIDDRIKKMGSKQFRQSYTRRK